MTLQNLVTIDLLFVVSVTILSFGIGFALLVQSWMTVFGKKK